MSRRDEMIANMIAAGGSPNHIRAIGYGSAASNLAIGGGIGYGLHRYAANRPGQSHHVNHALQVGNAGLTGAGLFQSIDTIMKARRL